MSVNRDLPPKPVRRSQGSPLVRGIVAAACALTLLVGISAPVQADELDERKKELTQEIANQADAVDQAHANRNTAVKAASDARDQLAEAEASLARAEAAERESKELDKQREQELADAERKLTQAKADVAAARAALDSVNSRLDEEILVTTQQNNGLMNLALIFSDVDPSNLNQRAQLADTLFDSSARQLDELETRRLNLENAQAEADAAEQAATDARKKAADQLAASKRATSDAESDRAEVDRLSKAKDAAEAAANSEVVSAEQRQSDLEAESASVETRIQQRIAAEKKAAEEKAARERAAAEAERKANAAAAAKRAQSAKGSASHSPSRPSSSSGSSSTGSKPSQSSEESSSSSSGFIHPVAARITSPFGMRLHPVLGYWKLHDGTDFGASCNTPMRAAADGVVSERYFNAGYGNRLMIDHGKINGKYVTTGYNHATRYVVSVGQRVSQGQVIGYVGTTGYSTGCHLHLMVWENGKVVNPMAKWFR